MKVTIVVISLRFRSWLRASRDILGAVLIERREIALSRCAHKQSVIMLPSSNARSAWHSPPHSWPKGSLAHPRAVLAIAAGAGAAGVLKCGTTDRHIVRFLCFLVRRRTRCGTITRYTISKDLDKVERRFVLDYILEG